jgi:hypothetical protein
MFLKRMRRRVNRKRFTYWALVESVRTERGPRQRVVAYLGELRSGERAGWAALAQWLERKDRPQPSLFDPPVYPEPPEKYEVVNLKGLRLERMRDFGDVWLAWGLWRLLGLDGLLKRLMPEGREQVPWPDVAVILAIARFCEPSSELHIEDTWYPRTALDDLLGVEPSKVHTDRLYDGLDQLLPCKDAIEKHGGGDREEVRPGESCLGDGPGDGQRGQPSVHPRSRRLIHRGHAQGDATAV